MRRVIGLCMVLAFVGAPRSSRPCSIIDYSVPRPEQDLGVVEGHSPETPSISGAVKRSCSDDAECCISVLEISVGESAADLFQVDGQWFVRSARPGVLVISFHPGRPPFEVEVVAWREIGYRSEPARFLVTESVGGDDQRSGGGCG